MFQKTIAKKSALACKSIVNDALGGPPATRTLVLTINPKLSSSDPPAADEMDLWCPEGDPDEEDRRIVRLIPFGGPNFRIPESWHRNKPVPDLELGLPVLIIRNKCPMRQWQLAQRRLLKCVHEFGQHHQFEKLDYVVLPGGQVFMKYPDPNSDDWVPPYPNIHFQCHWFPDLCRPITDEEIAYAFDAVWPVIMT